MMEAYIPDHPLTRGFTVCPICLKPKDRGLVVHWGRCYRESGFKDGTPEVNAVVDTFEAYLEAVAVAVVGVSEDLAAPLRDVLRPHQTD